MRRFWLCALILCLFPALALGQAVDTSFTQTAPPSPVGSGARAMGTGGAFIAIADDATAANWNPAGVVQLLAPEFSVVGTADQSGNSPRLARYYYSPNYSAVFPSDEVMDSDEISYQQSINHMSLVFPFSVAGMNVVVSANYQRLWDFKFRSDYATTGGYVDRTATVLDPTGTPPVVALDTYTRKYPFDISTKKDGALEALSPVVAVQITPTFSMGFAYNFWNDNWLGEGYKQEYTENQGKGVRTGTSGPYWVDSGDISNCTCNGGNVCDFTNTVIDDPSCLGAVTPIFPPASVPPTVTPALRIESEEEIEMEGQNFTIGFLWEVDPQWTIGGVYRSEFEVAMERDVTYRYFGYTPARPDLTFEYDDRMRMPASYGLGVAYRHSDALTVALDLSRIEWNRYRIDLDGGRDISPVNGLPISRADIDPTTTARLGMEYLFIEPTVVIPFRMGVFYDPDPARSQPDDYYGVAVGTGLSYEQIIFDVAYVYRWGDDVTLYTNYDKKTGAIEEIKGDAYEQTIMASLIIHFI